jgi:Tol biopolymer transport system component
MPLAATTRLGPYEIISPLGAGGMGEVYRARDTRLGREVAVKVLPQHLSENPEVRARFEREAKTVSSLNHPHICTLFDVGHENGIDYLVMELVEGETLAARLTKGALPAAEVLKLGAQIADALDRAHRAGVIHRDLKPGNVMLTRGGAKLMDFGLARATGLDGPGGSSGMSHAALTHSPTVASPLTAEGTIVGTFQYMAPEQLEGGEADQRSDLWGFGCVLYEMATGRRAFDGRSQASLISAIMSTEPAPVSQVAPLAPPGLDRLVRTCLAKDPEERARSAHDIKLQLLGMQEAGSQSAAAVPIARRHGKNPPLAWIIAAIATAAAIAMAILLATRDRNPRVPVHVAIEPVARQTLQIYAASMAISPDGRCVAYAAADTNGAFGLWLRAFDSPTARRLGPANTAAILFWSPDSRAVGVIGNGTKLVTFPIERDTPTEVCATRAGRGATWNQHGVIVFAQTPQGPLYRVPATGGEPVQVTWPDSSRHESGHRFPCFLPDGDHFLFVSMPAGSEGFDIYAGSLGSKETKRILTAESAVTYAAPGYLLFRHRGKLTAQRFDAKGLKMLGDPIALVDAPPISDLDAEPIASASSDGRLVVLDNPPSDTNLGWLDRDGVLRATLSLPTGPWERPVLSPDDRYAVVPKSADLWRIDLARSLPIRLTSDAGYENEPVWSPDGSKIAYTSGGRAREEIMVMNSDGSGPPVVQPTTDHLFKLASSWSRQGLLLAVIDSRTIRDVVLVPYPEGRPVTTLAGTGFAEFGGKVSPDGRWLAYISNEAGAPADLYLQSFPVPGHKIRVTNGGAEMMWWMPGGDELCYRTADHTRMMSVKLGRLGENIEVGEPRLLFRYPPDVEWSDLTHDGQRILVTISSEGARNRRARVVLNWTAMMKQ